MVGSGVLALEIDRWPEVVEDEEDARRLDESPLSLGSELTSQAQMTPSRPAEYLQQEKAPVSRLY